MFDTKEKRERAVGTRLFLKPFRSATPKSAMVRRPYRPGAHGKERRRVGSEYSRQLLEKQKIKYTYGLRDAQMRRLFTLAAKSPQTTGDLFMSLLERRLDNVVFRAGLAPSRSIARQLVNHGHIQVNGKRVKAPSFQVKVGEVITVREQSKRIAPFKDISEKLKKFESPSWLVVDGVNISAEVKALPRDFEVPFDTSLIIDYYSKLVK